MFFKLALRNVRRSFRDYGVYLLTLTFGVCLFYTFNSLDGQGAIVYLAQKENSMVEVILSCISIFSVFVAVVLACLILYANRFLLRRRKRELGTYLLLGLGQGQVSLVLVLETGLVALVSLVLGLGLGVLASLGLSQLTLSMFQISMDGMLGLHFSLKAAGKTVLYFGLIFLLVMFFSGVQVSRSKLLDLMQGERRNEPLRQRPLKWAVVQCVLGVLCLGAAYALLLLFGMMILAMPMLCVPMLALGTVGTLLIFRSLSGFVLRLAQTRPGFYYKNLNLFTLREWMSKVHSTYLAQTVICILLLLAMGITASSIGLNSTLDAATRGQAPFDITIQNQNGDVQQLDFDGELKAAGFDTEKKLSWQKSFLVYYGNTAVTGLYSSGVIGLSDYNALREKTGEGAYTGALPAAIPWEEVCRLVNNGLGMDMVVVDDAMLSQLEVRRQIWVADYAGDAEETEAELVSALSELPQTCITRTDSRLMLYQDLMGSKILALFLGLYLGLTFLLAAAAVLALQQLSQGADNAGRYAILRRLGAQESMVSRCAVEQVALAFLLPLALALLHSAVGMKAANDFIAQAGKVDALQSTLFTALMLLVVYGGYFLATALACRRLALQDPGERR